MKDHTMLLEMSSYFNLFENYYVLSAQARHLEITLGIRKE
jgi:hypothetical protein